MNFSVGAGMLGGIENGADPSRPKPGQGEFGNENRTAQMQCFPIFSVLLALGMYLMCLIVNRMQEEYTYE